MGTFAELRAAAPLLFEAASRRDRRGVPARAAADAQRRLEEKEQFGKIVLETVDVGRKPTVRIAASSVKVAR
jgi:hypothetical protein